MKKYTVTHWGKYAPDAYVSNGVIGFRFPKDPFERVLGLMAGFTTLREKMHVEALAVLPAPRYRFALDGREAEPEILKQSYDFSNGEFFTEAVLCAGGKTVTVGYTVYCSRTSPTLLLSHLSYAGDPCVLSVRLGYEVRPGYEYTLGPTKPYEGNDSFDGK